ncbi:MAG: IS110 family transposase [Candidatus Omnitrophica bacterium]|nr:IS110 family transposase [Candidatus Omnitrophota bacterium]
MEKLYHIGVDLHRKNLQVAVLNKEGDLLDMRKLGTNDKEVLKEYFSSFPEETPVVIESTTGWEWLSDLLEEEGLEVKLANPQKVKLIAEATIKTDKIDATTLAQLERTNFLPCSYLAPRQIRERRELLRHRMILVRLRTGLKSRVHSVLSKKGIITEEITDLFGKRGREFLKEVELPDIYKEEMNTYLNLIDTIDKHIERKEKQIRKIVKEEELAKLLMTIPGISWFSALLLLSEIGDIARFSSPKKLCSYAGLVPTTSQTDETVYHGHLKKDSNKYIKWVVIEAVEHIIKKDPVLRYEYEKILRSKGKNKARVAIARKLCISIYYMLKNKQVYKMRERKRKRFIQVNP